MALDKGQKALMKLIADMPKFVRQKDYSKLKTWGEALSSHADYQMRKH